MQRRAFCLLACAAFLSGAVNGADDKPERKEASGIDLGHDSLELYVARDKETWKKVKQEFGGRQMLPIGFAEGDSLDRLDDVDFEKQMVVAVFWGKIAFSRNSEKCRIDKVTIGKDAVTVACTATLWGGSVSAAYRAWPYHAMAVPKSELPVTFRQTTILLARPEQIEKEKPLATLKPTEWQWKRNAKAGG